MSGRPCVHGSTGIWGPVTATLDWCEANYQFSPYVAEMANTLSNIFTISLAVFGASNVRAQSFPTRYLVGAILFALVGIGSFAFHATLLFSAQLADELPMIYVATTTCFTLLDTAPGYGTNPRGKILLVSAILFDILFTLTYWLYRNPVYHQVVFATMMLTIAVRVTYLLHYHPASIRISHNNKKIISRIFWTGSGMFAFGFLIWNLDNIFCGTLTRWKVNVGWPLAFFLEGHSWWHVFTAAGSYLMSVGHTYLTLCIKDSPQNYTVAFLPVGMPFVKRVKKVKD